MDIKIHYFSDSHEWRRWLLENHDKEKESWLSICKKRSRKTGIRHEEAIEEALCFGWIDGGMRSIDKETFILRFSPRNARSIWSKRNKEKAELLTQQGRMTEAGLARIEEAKKNGMWQAAYSSRVREEIPDDLEAALLVNQVAWKNFHNLANTYRFMYIRWLNGARTEEIRRQRVGEIVKRVELNQKVRSGKI
jgi:uncharacterized protein YdeI (YjbR/CyaY-like superfamily)